MAGGIYANVRGMEKVQKFLESVPVGVKGAALQAINDVILSAAKSPPPYQYVARFLAYGVSFFTPKQNAWFWANGGPAMIGDHRTGAITDAWETSGGDKWSGRETIWNRNPDAVWLFSNAHQARQLAMVGWKTIGQIVKDNLSAAIKAAKDLVHEWIKQNED
jgi:hypothetical protein